MVDAHEIYCDNHFIMYVSQITMLSTLNLYIAVCQLYLKFKEKQSKTTKKKRYSSWTIMDNLSGFITKREVKVVE